MTLKTRRLMWGGFVILFFLVIPGIVVYAAGWRFDPGVQWFVRTSTIIIASYPREATVTIEGDKKTHSPGWIKFLHPGERRVTVEGVASGRWEKTLTLVPGKVTFAEHVILFSPGKKVYLAPLPNLNPRRTMTKLKDLSEGGLRITNRERKQPGGDLVLRQASPYELMLFNPKTNEEELLQRRSKPIIRTEWFPPLIGLPEKSGWVIFADQREIIVIEIDARDPRNMATLASVDRIDDFAITADGLELLVAGRVNQREGIYSLPLFQSSTTE